MLLEITGTDFFSTNKWLFKLKNEAGDTAFIKDETFYKTHQLKNPIGRPHLDTYDIGMQIIADAEDIEGELVVTKITQFLVQPMPSTSAVAKPAVNKYLTATGICYLFLLAFNTGAELMLMGISFLAMGFSVGTNEDTIMLRLIAFALGAGTFFGLITLLFTWLFRNTIKPSTKFYWRVFFAQWGIFAIGFWIVWATLAFIWR